MTPSRQLAFKLSEGAHNEVGSITGENIVGTQLNDARRCGLGGGQKCREVEIVSEHDVFPLPRPSHDRSIRSILIPNRRPVDGVKSSLLKN